MGDSRVSRSGVRQVWAQWASGLVCGFEFMTIELGEGGLTAQCQLMAEDEFVLRAGIEEFVLLLDEQYGWGLIRQSVEPASYALQVERPLRTKSRPLKIAEANGFLCTPPGSIVESRVWLQFARVGLQPEEWFRILCVRLDQRPGASFFSFGIVANAAGGQKVVPLECSDWVVCLGMVGAQSPGRRSHRERSHRRRTCRGPLSRGASSEFGSPSASPNRRSVCRSESPDSGRSSPVCAR